MSEEEQRDVRICLKEHYFTVLHDKEWNRKSNNIQMYIMLGIGLFFLSVYLLFALTREDNLFIEILSIIGSFSLWEVADRFLVQRKDIRKEMYAAAQNVIQNIEFCPGTPPQGKI